MPTEMGERGVGARAEESGRLAIRADLRASSSYDPYVRRLGTTLATDVSMADIIGCFSAGSDDRLAREKSQ